ncbi:MAG TPA: S8 family serine peptidase [Gaiellaceae bacterium]|nr:S8 family serine peptidase [Gaiellaceae bacterium]
MDALRRLSPALLVGLLAALALLASGGASARTGGASAGGGDLVEVVVTLPQPPLARELARDRSLASAVRTRAGVDVRAPAAVAYLRTLAAAQRTLQARLASRVPDSRVNWHYAVALNGIAVVLPRSELPRLRSLPGATVWPSVTYHDLGTRPAAGGASDLNVTPAFIGATALWGSDLATAGQGVKIAIVDDGIDQTHKFFSPAGFSYPPGFPKGNTAYTTPKVIVARAFPSPSTTWKYANRPFDPEYSEHATHVAGIAAGDHDTVAASSRGTVKVSGIAPKAYLGNYKVLTVPTEDYGLDGNAPEIAKAIDQAVADGMNVINLSLGEPEVEPSRDVVVTALDNAAAAGVVPVVAAGNDYTNAGHGSVGSPANAPAAITVAASTEPPKGDQIAYFSSAGPTPISLEMKPDVTAPGENVLSSIPRNSWDIWDGTSMATPHVAGAAALLRQRHPTWTVEQVKSALALTGDPVHPAGESGEVPTTREGGGRIDLVRADKPLVFTDPSSLSWGLVRHGFVGTKQLVVSDAGGGLDPWTVSIATQQAPAGVTVTPDAGTVVPGTTLAVTLAVAQTAAEGDATGFVELTRGSDVRRVPFWFHVEVPQLGLDPHTTLTKPGLYRGDTAGKASRVSSYRYPERGVAPGVATDLSGPEQVFRFTLRKPVANFGVAVLSRGTGVRVSPRIVRAGDENRLVGYTGLPATLNPYVGLPTVYPVVGAILPAPGAYDVVFDTPAGGTPGTFLFRFWVADTAPPKVKLLASTVRAGAPIRLAVSDAGSGVDPVSISTSRDGTIVPFSYAHGVVSLATTTLAPGTHRIVLTVADYQETKNMEDVGPVRPNTRVFRATVTVKP